MPQLNGQKLTPDPAPLPEPKHEIARLMYEAGYEDGDAAFDELADDEREALESYAADYIGCHMKWLERHGFRILPPGAVLRPKTDEEAGAMAHAVKLWNEAKTRKGGLIGSAAPKLILPKGVH